LHGESNGVTPKSLNAGPFLRHGQREAEHAPASQFAFHPQPAALSGDELAGNTQAQIRAAAVSGFVRYLGEALKDALVVLRRDAWSPVLHADFHLIAQGLGAYDQPLAAGE